MPNPKVTPGSGNDFDDLGLPDAEEYQAKAKLALRIIEILRTRKLSQTKAAALLGVDQPKISALLHGRLDGFSVERLFHFLNALGRDIEIVIRQKPEGVKNGHVRVMTTVEM